MWSSCGDAGNQPSRENWEPNIRFGLESRKSLNRAGLWEIEKREPVRRQEGTISTAGHRVGKRRVERKISSESARCAGRVVSLRRPLRYKALMKKVEMVGKMKSHPGNQKCHGKTPRSGKKKPQNLVSTSCQNEIEINRKAFGDQASVEEQGSPQREMKEDDCVRQVCSGQSGYPPFEGSADQRQRFERGST